MDFFKAGAECGELRGKVMILVRALYCLKRSGASCRSTLKEFIENNLHFKSTQIDSDVYIRRNRREKGTEYYELLLVYVDEVLVVSHPPGIMMKDIGLKFDIKDRKYVTPTAYLGTNV